MHLEERGGTFIDRSVRSSQLITTSCSSLFIHKMKRDGTLNPPGTSLIPLFCFRLGFFVTSSSSDEEPRDETNPDVQVRSPRWLQDLLQIWLRRCQLVGQLVPPVRLAAEIRTVPQEQPAHLPMTSLCSLPKQSQINVPQTVRGRVSGRTAARSLPYAKETRRRHRRPPGPLRGAAAVPPHPGDRGTPIDGAAWHRQASAGTHKRRSRGETCTRRRDRCGWRSAEVKHMK